MSIPVFIDLESNSQLAELRSYLKSKNVDIVENREDLSDDNLVEVIEVSEQLWKEVNNEQELEMVFNSIISLVIVLPREKIEPITLALCQQLSQPLPGNDRKNICKLKLLNNLFIGLDDSSPLRYNVYTALVRLAGLIDQVNMVNIRLEDVKTWVMQWKVGVAKYQALLRTLHEVFINAKQSEKASKVMIELLGTYSEENASQAREDARRCIATCIADPSVLLFDHLLLLKPVKFLEGEPIHDLVTVFVTGKLPQYMSFYQKHKNIIESNGLNHDDNMKKMRLLTFLSLAEVSDEIAYETIQSELQLQSDQVELFIIEVIRSKAAQVKIMQTQKKVIVQNALNRTFGKAQWVQLRDKLSVWQANLTQVAHGLQSVSANA